MKLLQKSMLAKTKSQGWNTRTRLTTRIIKNTSMVWLQQMLAPSMTCTLKAEEMTRPRPALTVTRSPIKPRVDLRTQKKQSESCHSSLSGRLTWLITKESPIMLSTTKSTVSKADPTISTTIQLTTLLSRGKSRCGSSTRTRDLLRSVEMRRPSKSWTNGHMPAVAWKQRYYARKSIYRRPVTLRRLEALWGATGKLRTSIQMMILLNLTVQLTKTRLPLLNERKSMTKSVILGLTPLHYHLWWGRKILWWKKASSLQKSHQIKWLLISHRTQILFLTS